MNIAPKHTASPLNIFTTMTRLAKQYNAVNLSQGLPDYPVAPELSGFLKEAVLEGYNQYAPMPGLHILREQIAADLNKRYQTTQWAADRITITPGATYGIYTSLTIIINKGDEVVYFEPAFDCYLPAIEINGGIPVAVALQAENFFCIDWQAVHDAITDKTRAILINTPHNPTGYVWTETDWNSLACIIGDKEIYVISDEVYDSVVFDGGKHYAGFMHPELKDKIISIYSFGKSFHITGWKIGYCIAAQHLTDAFRSVHQYLSFSVNTPAQYALAKFLNIYDNGATSKLLKQKRDLLIEGLMHSKLKQLATSAGTYFQLYDYTNISNLNDVEFAKWLTIQYKVAVIPLSAFYKKKIKDKIVRLCFAKKDEVLLKAIEFLNEI